MKVKASGIVTRTIKYKDSSIITDIYTDQLGLQSYIVNNIRSSRSKISIGLFQPLTQLSIVAYYKEDSSLKRLSEVTCSYPYVSIHADIKKTAIAIFLAEFLSKVCKTTESYPDLFTFIAEELQGFDRKEDSYESFHLFFMIQLSRYLGFLPVDASEMTSQLGLSFNEQESEYLDNLINNNESKVLTYKERKYLLDAILDFYRLHIDGFSKMTSISILHEVLKN